MGGVWGGRETHDTNDEEGGDGHATRLPIPEAPLAPPWATTPQVFGRQQEEPMGKKGRAHTASSSHRTQIPSTHAPKRAAGFPLNATDFPTKAFVLSCIHVKSSPSSNRNTEHVNMIEKTRVEHTRDGSFANCRRPDANGPYKPTRSHTAFAHRLYDIAGTTVLSTRYHGTSRSFSDAGHSR